MKPSEFKEITLSSMANGSVEQVFQRELHGVLKNIDDMNTDAKATREINLKIKLKPNSDRDHCELEVQCSSKRAPMKAVEASFHVVNEKGTWKGFEKEVSEGYDNITSIGGNRD